MDCSAPLTAIGVRKGASELGAFFLQIAMHRPCRIEGFLMPVFPIGTAALIAGLAQMPPWIAAVAIFTVAAVGVMQTNRKLHALQHGPDVVAARTPGAIFFSLLVYSLVIGLPYLTGIGIRSAID